MSWCVLSLWRHACSNVANFNRRFLEVKGVTPSEFRRQADHRFRGARS